MSKFRVGDKVKVLRTSYPGTIDVGEVRTILSLYNSDLLLLDDRNDTHENGLAFNLDQVEIIEVTTNEGIKHDSGKPPVSLIPVEATLGMAKVFAFGAKKYGRHNFRKGMDHSRVLDAAQRHILAIVNGEDTDPESNEPHWAHALCCLAMYAYFKSAGVGKDDRYKPETKE